MTLYHGFYLRVIAGMRVRSKGAYWGFHFCEFVSFLIIIIGHVPDIHWIRFDTHLKIKVRCRKVFVGLCEEVIMKFSAKIAVCLCYDKVA